MEFLLHYVMWMVVILATIAVLLGLFFAGYILVEAFKIK